MNHSDDEVMCYCSGTTRGEIKSLFKEGKDAEAISRWTGALSGCGGCEWDIAELLNTLSSSDSNSKAAQENPPTLKEPDK